MDIQTAETIFESCEDAIAQATRYAEANPDTYYHNVQVGDRYMIRYGDSSLVALWKPNDFRFFKQEYAEKIAKIFQDQGKVFDY